MAKRGWLQLWPLWTHLVLAVAVFSVRVGSHEPVAPLPKYWKSLALVDPTFQLSSTSLTLLCESRNAARAL